MIDIGLGHYLTLGAVIFSIGVIGIFLNRKNIIVILMSIELILLAVNVNLVAFSIYLGDLAGQVFTLFILTVAAAEAAIGLAIIVVYFRNSGTIRVEEIDKRAEIETSTLVTISEFLSPIYFPKKPEIIDAISGRNIIDSSIIIPVSYTHLTLPTILLV